MTLISFFYNEDNILDYKLLNKMILVFFFPQNQDIKNVLFINFNYSIVYTESAIHLYKLSTNFIIYFKSIKLNAEIYRIILIGFIRIVCWVNPKISKKFLKSRAVYKIWTKTC